MHIFEKETDWQFDLIPKISSYECIRGTISREKLSELTHKPVLIDGDYFEIIIYIPDKSPPKGLMLFPTSKLYMIVLIDKNIFDITNQYDINILNLQSLIKTYTVFNYFLDTDKLSCKL
jgi:uncharacterized protein YqgQ